MENARERMDDQGSTVSASQTSAPPPSAPHAPTTLARLPALLVALLFAAGATLLLLVSWNRELQVDEVEHIHTAYNMRDGRTIYRDFVQVHPPAFYAWLYPLVDPDDPVGSIRRARALSAATLVATIALVGWCGFRLEGRQGALLAAGFALLHTTLVERGMEVRGDGLIALLTMIALALELGWLRLAETRRYALEALALGLALMVSLKAIFPIALFGLLWVADAVRRRRPAFVLAPLAAGLAPFAVALAATAATGGLHGFVEQSLLDATSAGTGSAARSTFSPDGFLFHEGTRNVAFSLTFFFAIFRELRALATKEAEGGRRRFVLFLALGLFLSLWAHPFPWPYAHVSVLPPMALLAACGALGALRAPTVRGAPWTRWVAPLLLLLAAATALPRLASKSVPALSLQFETLAAVERASAPDDRFFDLAGLYFRPDAYPLFSMSGDLFRWYTFGRFPPIPETLRANEAVGIVLNYRVGWLRPSERRFVAERFVHANGNLFLLGRDLAQLRPGEESEFEALKSKRFRVDGEAELLVDGAPFEEGELARGVHTLRLERLAGPGRLILASAPALFPPAEPRELFVNFD